jgi:hypothetical protein
MPRMSLVAWSRTSLLTSLCLLASSCCFTNALWEEDPDDEEREPIRVRVVEATRRHEHRVHVAVVTADDEAKSLRLAALDGPDDDGGEAWQLAPIDGEDLAGALLTDRRLLGRCSLSIDVLRDREQGDIVWSQATLALQGAFDVRSLGAAVDPVTLGPAVRERLEAASAGQDAFARPLVATPTSAWLQRLDERLRAVDFRALTPDEPSPWVAYTVVLVDRTGQPWQPVVPSPAVGSARSPGAGSAVPAEAAAAAGAAPPRFPRSRSHELSLLAGVQAVVAATNGTVTRTFVLPADQAVLWSLLGGAADGHFDSRSTWRFLADAPAAVVPAAATGAEAWPLAVVDRDIGYRDEARGVEDFWGKLALTPLAIAGDLAVGWLLRVVGVDACGCDDDDDDDPRRRRR